LAARLNAMARPWHQAARGTIGRFSILGSVIILNSCLPRATLTLPPFSRCVPNALDQVVTFSTDLAEEAAQAAMALDEETMSHLASASEYGGLVCLTNIVGPKLRSQMNTEAKALRGSLKPSKYWNEWQEGRADAYCLIDQATCELMGYPAMTFAIELLTAVCQRLADFDGKLGVIRPTSKLQLACFAAGSTGYDAHTDGSNLEELDQSMPEDQRNMISSRRITAILYLNEDWDDLHGGALRALGDGSPLEVSPQGGSLILFRSRDLTHQVLPTSHDRYALTMWYVSD